MDCPDCGVEMVDLAGDDQTIRKCGECGGLWIDVSDLNRLLLHNNLPGLESLGGRANPDAMTGQCSECQVDLMRIEGGDKNHPITFDTCESCGGVFVGSENKETSDFDGATKEIVAFFKEFAKAGRKKAAV
jgi:Zn-finger nucleic acid-binding protein